MIKFILKLKLNYLIWKCKRSHKKWLKLVSELHEMRGAENE